MNGLSGEFAGCVVAGVGCAGEEADENVADEADACSGDGCGDEGSGEDAVDATVKHGGAPSVSTFNVSSSSKILSKTDVNLSGGGRGVLGKLSVWDEVRLV